MQIEHLEEQLERFEVENEQIKEQAKKLVEKIKKEESEKEFQVDRRMINQFLVSYLNKTSDHNTQMNMLKALSKILQFTEEEKLVLGLVEDKSNRGFSQQLVSFLMNDDDD